MVHVKSRSEAVVTIACVQMEPVVGDKERNIRRSLVMIEEAAGKGADLVVLPELCSSGYVFESREEAFALSEEIPAGEACTAWGALAERAGIHIVAGINEREGNLLYNSSVVIGPIGHVGTFRKLHLWNEENLFFEPGNLGMPVFRTPIGRIAIASEARFDGRRYQNDQDRSRKRFGQRGSEGTPGFNPARGGTDCDD